MYYTAMRLFSFLLRPIFYLLYHQFAWTYDFVAAVVSLGRWNDWVHGILPYVEGPRVLELGHGPGHLQVVLNKKGFQVFGLDGSRFMGRQAHHRLRKKGFVPRLSHGYAQDLPFASAAFETVAATFPAEYILDARTLTEAQRVLVPGGRLVILPLAWITGRRPLERLAAWLFRVTGEVSGPPGYIHPTVKDRFTHAGFEVRSETVEQKGSVLLVILARKAK
jgi:ubiquinone/menaquinone biosynthesis C-methylase UbiE